MRARVSEDIRRQIEKDIADGRLVPGDKVDEQYLSKRFSVSRTPAREALFALAADGLIVFRSRKGTEVSGVSPQEAIGMVEVLTALEAEAAGLSSRRMTESDRSSLRNLHLQAETAVRSGDTATYAKYNADFHAAIYAGARNEYLTREITGRLRTRVYRQISLSRRASLSASWLEHAAIVEAIMICDEASARQTMRTHISAGGTLFADMVSSITSHHRADRP
ncbi:DNA-binding GntR family transcriptional regulator [Rhizomicrobium palustre]|uniref:DNA-binding GntR family transcriptional regulator n=1 Tax=Rhizomicrobium palustre TaxID=189966 RepID=A0A846MUB4_9PROT|nr:DNA-binding GntR family transcriptional regulator [Rhizomicrobium palustre]